MSVFQDVTAVPFVGDSAEPDILESVGASRARLVVISHEDVTSAYKVLHHVRSLRPDLPVMVRTRDERHVDGLRAAGATDVVSETMEAGLMIVVHARQFLNVPLSRVVRRMQEQRESCYRLLREFFRGDSLLDGKLQERDADRLLPVLLPPESPAIGRALGDFAFDGIVVTALVRQGERQLTPSRETCLEAGDALVLFGSPEDLRRAERELLS